ncbi:MAG: hypothetical protein ACFE89_10085 [Candidatus Hodarchaeota archaeon]
MKFSQWLKADAHRVLAAAFLIAFALSVIPLILGFLTPELALVYLISAYFVVFLTLFGICLLLLGYHNQVARRLAIIVAITSLIGVIANFWLLVEILFLGFSITFPNGTAYLSAIANIVLLVGFAMVSIEPQRRSFRQLLGYLLITLFFLLCIFSTYQMNLTFHPPIIPAIGLGLRILVGFFTAIFAWSFYFNRNPPREVIGTRSRFLLVTASLLLVLAYTAFAFQYAMGFTVIDTIFYSGSISDTLTLFAIFSFLIAVLNIFMEGLQGTHMGRPVSIRYAQINRIVLIITLAVILTLSAIAFITVTDHILSLYLTAPLATVALQNIGVMFLITLGVILTVGGAVSYYLSFLLNHPLQNLQIETSAVIEPGITAYTEPPGLIFSELQAISDTFIQILTEMARVRAELRRFTISEHRLRLPSTSQLSRLDYYFALLGNQLTNRMQNILSLAELGNQTTDSLEQKQLFERVQVEVAETQYLQDSIQLLRLIDAQALPELQRLDLCSIMTQLLSELQEMIPESSSKVALNLPEESCYIFANQYVNRIFLPILRHMLEVDSGVSTTIAVTLSRVTEYDVEYWQTEISHPKWVLSDVEKSLLFRFIPEEPQRGNPNLLVVPVLVDYFRGKFRIENRVTEEAQYGTVLRILLPLAKRGQKYLHKSGQKSDSTG